MKLTAEQKQLFHDCVDLALAVNSSKTDGEVEVNMYKGCASVKLWTNGVPSPLGFDYSQLPQAKDCLTKKLEK